MGKKILVAEDDSDIALILEMILKNAGYNVESTLDGASVIADKENWPDLFILDKDIPSVDGLTICAHLKSKKETQHIPVIMITCFHYLRKKAMDAGIDEFIEKPFELHHLLEVVDKCINREDPVPA